MSRPTNDCIKASMFKYRDNDGHPNYRRLMASLIKRYSWDKMTSVWKWNCQHCVICNRAKPDRRSGASLQPLGIPEYAWEFIGIYYVTDLSKSGLYGHTTAFIMICHLTKIAHLFHATRRSL
jgi:hypothetical protein